MSSDMGVDDDQVDDPQRPRQYTRIRAKSNPAQPLRRSSRLTKRYALSTSTFGLDVGTSGRSIGASTSRVFEMLPKEIMSEILLDACRVDNATPQDHTAETSTIAPLRLSHVSRLWRTIALASPALWSHLQLIVSKDRLNSALELVKLWVPRSLLRPLIISVAFNIRETALDLYEQDSLSLFRVIIKTAELLRNDVAKRAGNTLMESQVQAGSSGTTPVLEERYVWYYGVGEDGVSDPLLARAKPDPDSIRHFPMQVRGVRHAVDEFSIAYHAPLRDTLTRLELRDTNGVTCLSPSELVEIISFFPLLEWLEAYLVHGGLENDEQMLEPVYAPAMRKFKLGWAFFTNSATTLDALNLPNLTHLELSGDLIRGPAPWAHLFNFIVRSRPPIRTFALEHFDATASASRLADCLTLLPTLSSLWLENCVMDDDFILSLARRRVIPEMHIPIENRLRLSPSTDTPYSGVLSNLIPDNVLSRLRIFGIVGSDDISGDALIRAFNLALDSSSESSPSTLKEIFIFDCIGVLQQHCDAIVSIFEGKANVETILVTPGDEVL